MEVAVDTAEEGLHVGSMIVLSVVKYMKKLINFCMQQVLGSQCKRAG